MSDTQPKPTPGVEDVTPEARLIFNAMLSNCEERGVLTYGTTLQTWNGRHAVQDLLEELVDAFQYAVQEGMERSTLEEEIEELGRTVSDLEAKLRQKEIELERQDHLLCVLSGKLELHHDAYAWPCQVCGRVR